MKGTKRRWVVWARWGRYRSVNRLVLGGNNVSLRGRAFTRQRGLRERSPHLLRCRMSLIARNRSDETSTIWSRSCEKRTQLGHHRMTESVKGFG